MKWDALERYLRERTGGPVSLEDVRELGGEASGKGAIKQFGYGRPLLVSYRADDQEHRLVIHRIRKNAFGREREDDRVAAVWLDYRSFNQLERHVPALDMLLRTGDGAVRSVGDAEELLLVTGFRPGRTYATDLVRILEEGRGGPEDVSRVDTLACYLAEIHQERREDPPLWRRRLRDLIGDGECIFGLTDSYPENAVFTSPEEFRSIEELANRWRWRLKPRHDRLAQVHGDFHPFNILFEDDGTLHVLDRSRGPWGEPADDVSCLSINYLFFSLRRGGRLEGTFESLHERFWETYLDRSKDDELLEVIQPWLAWRALVLASPRWYPDLTDDQRRMILRFAREVLNSDRYDPSKVNSYMGESP